MVQLCVALNPLTASEIAAPVSTTCHDASSMKHHEQTPLPTSPLRFSGGPASRKQEEVARASTEDEEAEESCNAHLSGARQTGASTAGSSAVLLSAAPMTAIETSPESQDVHRSLTDSEPDSFAPESRVHVDSPPGPEEVETVSVDTKEEEKPLTPVVSPSAGPFNVLPPSSCGDDGECLKESTDGSLAFSLEYADGKASTVQPKQQSMLPDPQEGALRPSNTSLVVAQVFPESASQDHLLGPTAFASSLSVSKNEESEHIGMWKGQLELSVHNNHNDSAVRAKLRKVRRTYSMPVSENSVFFEQPGVDFNHFTAGIQRKRRNGVDPNDRAVKRQRSDVLDRAASPLDVANNSSPAAPNLPGMSNATLDQMPSAKIVGSEHPVERENTEIPMPSYHVSNSARGTAQGEFDGSFTSEQIAGFGSSSAAHIRGSSERAVPDVSHQAWGKHLRH